MNYAVKTDRVCTAGVIYEDSTEQTVDADLALPDYCPDIRKILKCCIEPQIDSRNIVGDRLAVAGSSLVRVIYIDAIKNSVRCAEQSYPFEITANLPDTPQSSVIATDIRVSYLNCRALSPRRLNIHGAFTVSVRVTDRSEQHVCTHIKGEDIQQKKLSVEYSSLRGLTQQQFSVTEALERSQSTPAVQSVVRSDIRAVSRGNSFVSGKLMYKGELLVKLLYISDLDSGKLETLEYNIPFSQVIAVEGAGEKSELSVSVEVMNSSVTLRTEIGFDDPLPVLSAKLCVTVFSYEKQDTMLVTDCYSTAYTVQTERIACTVPLLSSVVSESVVERSNVDFTDASVSKVIDVWCERGAAVVEAVKGKAVLRGKYNICVLAQDSEGEVIYTERTMEYSRDLKQLGGASAELSGSVSAVCVSSGFRFCSEKRVEVRAELLVTGELYELTKVSSVSGVTADENAPCAREDASLILYYARKGEDIWSIAREYATSADRVRAENDLTEDILARDMMIMLPI